MFIAMVTFGSLSAKNWKPSSFQWVVMTIVFQSARVGAITKMKENVILFLMGVHCFAY